MALLHERDAGLGERDGRAREVPPPEEEPGGDGDPGDVSGDTELEANLLKIGLLVVVIDTVGEEEPTCEIVGNTLSKDNTKVPGRIRIKTASGTEYDSGFYEKKKSGMTVKYRGNGSARQDKKPYKIKLQSPADLLARGDDNHYRSKDWVLLASVNTFSG